jgi:P-type Cu2+ transporter
MNEAVDLSLFVRHAEDGSEHMDFAVEGVNCAGCIRKIETGLKQIPGITEARLNFTNRRLAVGWRKGDLEPGDIVEAVARIGYRAHPFRPEQTQNAEARDARELTRCLAVAGFAAMNVMLLSVSVWSGTVDMGVETRDLLHWISALIALPAAAYAGRPFFRSAWRALRGGGVNMDVPISLGVVLALGLSVVETINHAEHAYFDSAVMLLFFLLCGRTLDHAMRRKTRTVAGNLAALKAEVAHRIEANSEVVTVPAAALRDGDRLLLRPGERMAADGTVLNGSSEIDESLVTGETARKRVTKGDTIHAGSLNYNGTLTVLVTAAGGDTLLADVERLLEKATAAKSRYLRLADRAARLYAPVVHTAAALTALAWLVLGASLHDSIVAAISVLIITCPCALALAIPAVQVVVSGALFRAGVILNAGDALERLAEVDTIVFDKTGTLTLPKPRVENAADIDPGLLESAARLALSSHHPLAAAVAREARERVPYAEAIEKPGKGVRATVDGRDLRLGSPSFCGINVAAQGVAAATSIIAFTDGERSALLHVRQTLRPDAHEVVAALRSGGFDIQILSGDRPHAVEPVAVELGVTKWTAGMRPADKIAALEALKRAGRRVLMVGDGLNDAPALAAAHASLSPITAVDLAQAQADAVFLGEQLKPVWETVTAAQRAHRLMLENLWLAAIYNAVAVPVAMIGLVTPLFAAVAMSGSSLLVTLNALRARHLRKMRAPVRNERS